MGRAALVGLLILAALGGVFSLRGAQAHAPEAPASVTFSNIKSTSFTFSAALGDHAVWGQSRYGTSSGGGSWGSSLQVLDEKIEGTIRFLTPNTTYYVGVRGEHNRAYSGATEGKVKTLLAKPAVTVARGKTSLALSWPDVSGAADYDVRYKASSTNTWGSWDEGESSPYTISSLTAGTEYDIEVRADASDNDGEPQAVSATTYALDAPSSVTVSEPSTNSLRVTWSTVANAAKYQTRHGTSSGAGTWTDVGGGSVAIGKTITGLTANTQYYIGRARGGQQRSRRGGEGGQRDDAGVGGADESGGGGGGRDRADGDVYGGERRGQL